MRHLNGHFSIIGEEKTEKIGTKDTKMPVAWLDLPRNNPGHFMRVCLLASEALKSSVTHIWLLLSKQSPFFPSNIIFFDY